MLVTCGNYFFIKTLKNYQSKLNIRDKRKIYVNTSDPNQIKINKI